MEKATIYTVTVHFENRPDKEIELLNCISEIPKDIQRAAMKKAETQSYHYQNGRTKPRPTWAEVEGKREVEIQDVS